MFKGTQRFVCKEGYGLFAPASTVIPVEDFYGYQQQERLSKSDGMTSMSLGYEVNNGRSCKYLAAAVLGEGVEGGGLWWCVIT